MKTKINKLFIVLFIPVIYFLFFTGFKETRDPEAGSKAMILDPLPKDFVNFILNPNYGDSPGAWDMENFLEDYGGELNFTGVHIYDEGNGNARLGTFNEPLSQNQINYVNGLITDSYNNGLKPVFERTKISRLCYGQRLEYEVSEGGSTTVNYGFCYRNCMSNTYEIDQGRTVLHATTGVNQPGRLCDSIYENLQHTDLYWFRPQQGDLDNWYIKPMLKIRQEDFNPNSTTEVAAIVTYNLIWNRIDSTIIRVRNFNDGTGNYSGDYIDNFYQLPMVVSGNKEPGGLNEGNYPGYYNEKECKVDFKVYWFGNVDVWLDKVTVDDEIAKRLFDPDPEQNHTSKIADEVNNFGQSGRMAMFFADECLHSNYPCIKQVSHLIDSLNAALGRDAKLVYAVSNALIIYSMRNDGFDYAYNLRLDYMQPKLIQLDAHCLAFYWVSDSNCYGGYIPQGVFTELDPKIPPEWVVSYETYNTWLQRVLGDKNRTNPPFEDPWPEEGSLVFQINRIRTQIDTYSPGTRLIIQPQIQHWSIAHCENCYFYYGVREPTNEEISVEAMIAIAHGADGLSWFWFPSCDGSSSQEPPGGWRAPNTTNLGQWHYGYGLMNTPTQKRTSNLFGQDKWQEVGEINQRINSLKSTLDALNWLSGYSVHREGASQGCITDIQSIPRNPAPPYEFNPVIGDQVKYWEMGFFEPSQPHFDEYIKYIMFVNRRCVPEEGNEGHGDVRQLKIKFNPEMLLNFNNWKICDVLNPGNVKVFDKNSGNYVDLGSAPGSMGYFLPGEGRLFKLVPVFKSGGILVTNENVAGTEEITCEDTVFNNGYNITIEDGARIHFTDSSTIVMSDSGTFTMGDAGHQGPPATTADAAPGCHWYGLNFSNCEVKIYSSKFEGLANDSTYAINIIDCPLVDIKLNTFNSASNLEGGISLTYLESDTPPNIYIDTNTFNSNNSILPTLNIMSFAGVTVPAIIEGNTFNSEGVPNTTAIVLSNMQGGAVKSNHFFNFQTSINALASSVDVSGNTLTSSVNFSFGIEALTGSEIKMNNAGELILGGRNDISITGDESNNILVNNSAFLLDNGENIFNIAGNVGSYHLYGFFPDTFSGSFEATKNCFKVDNTPVNPPVEDVTLGYQGNGIEFTFEPYLTGCTMGGEGDGLVINLGDGIYDTVGTRPGGGGTRGEIYDFRSEILEAGSKKSEVRSEKSEIRNLIINPKTLYDSICIQMRFRNYGYVKTKCTELINAYPDSIYSLNAIPKLYLATSMTDTTSTGLIALKTYYENLILNHPNNTALVKRCNYYVQKCKVLLHQYTSALAGFEQIMLQNPYSYEGLVARWDHMATQLLIQGHGGGAPPNLPEGEEFFGGDDDRRPFTREQKIMIVRSVNDALNTSRNADERRYIEVSKRSEEGNVEAKRELEVMRTLKEVVKPASPKNVFEHVKIVRHDMQRIFSSPATREAGKVNQLPTEFALSQNYPNPFNPVTRINYDLPKDSKVNLIIYDIIGREVKRLVNNEFKQAGRYVVEFNGTNLASGVYFYRIKMEDFVLAKKMVLVK